MCQVMYINSFISNLYNMSNIIEICTREDEPYGLQVAICNYSSPETLLRRLVVIRGTLGGGGGGWWWRRQRQKQRGDPNYTHL